MISQEQIQKIANKQQTTELNIRREYFQHLFLAYFYRQKQTDEIYFKGGTALRIIYQSTRFSEDLDFSTALSNVNTIEQIILSTLEKIEKEGIKVNIKDAKKTSGGYLARVIFSVFGQNVSILLQFSLREGDKKGEAITIVNDFIPTYVIIMLSKRQLINEKIKALIERKKPRDFYDLYFIIRANLLKIEKKEELSMLLKIVEHTKVNFEMELKQFLPKSHWPTIKNFNKSLKNELERYI